MEASSAKRENVARSAAAPLAVQMLSPQTCVRLLDLILGSCRRVVNQTSSSVEIFKEATSIEM